MTSKGTTLKAKTCPKSRDGMEDMKAATLPKSPGKDFLEERLNGTAKEQKPRAREKANQSEEKQSVLSPQKETTEHQRTCATKAPVQDTRPKVRAGSVKTTQQSAEARKKTKPEAPKDIKDDRIKVTTAKPCLEKAKSLPQPPEEMAKMQQEVPKDIKNELTKVRKAKSCSIKAKSLELPPEAPEDTKNAAVDSILNKTLEKLKIKKQERSDASGVVNTLVENIIAHLKQNTVYFKEVEQPLRTGSYYENLKIANPDEFDVMLPFPVDRVSIEPFGDDGAFYSVGLKREKNPLQKFQENGTLSSSMMLKEFREEVKKCAKKYPEWEMTKKKKGCPAVTLITKVQSVTISLDVVLSIVVKSRWPIFTKEGLKIDGWLGTKVKKEYKWKPYYLVPKYEGRGSVENDGVLAKDVWRVSFSHIEKDILKNHGSEKTCCEKGGVRCCRKDCLKLLKHLLSLLKERDPSFDKFCSYHAKTTLLHACCSRSKDIDWRASDLSHCFQLLLKNFVDYLERGDLPNFFIPSQNLLSGPGQSKCNNLARCIREERDKGFPIFK
ncbi:cyclic GMP-AMP synthase [Cheilinus undulatus]|uniref:cyclic GMP-AMP synthase n=1 Tax=Cheilinus undulatus TaxID=241271 RepID=UPI001BD32A45|nr:cyclic GMP-AMP synthase [Cheilinus undulatus]